jgi:hypothetical protein
MIVVETVPQPRVPIKKSRQMSSAPSRVDRYKFKSQTESSAWVSITEEHGLHDVMIRSFPPVRTLHETK